MPVVYYAALALAGHPLNFHGLRPPRKINYHDGGLSTARRRGDIHIFVDPPLFLLSAIGLKVINELFELFTLIIITDFMIKAKLGDFLNLLNRRFR